MTPRRTRRLPLTLKMVLATIAVGAAVWAFTDRFFTRAITDLFRQSLTEQLISQDQDYRIRFERHLLSYKQAVRLYAERLACVTYAGQADWSGPAPAHPPIHAEPPEWFVPNSTQRLFVAPNHALLLDASGKVREIFSAGGAPLPGALARPTPLMVRRARNVSHITPIDDVPYVVSSSPVTDEDGQTIATLVIASRLDERFLQASQGFYTKGIIVAIVRGEPLHVVASSDNAAVPQGMLLDEARRERLDRRQAFFQFGSGEVDYKFVTLAATAEINEMATAFLGKERALSGAAAAVFVAAFALLMFVTARRIKSLTDRVRGYAQQMRLGDNRADDRGDELEVLEGRFRRLMAEVRERAEQLESAYADVRRKAEELGRANERLKELDQLKSLNLAAVSRELRVLSQAIEQSPVTVVISDIGNRIEYVNPQFERTSGYSREEAIGKNPLTMNAGDKIQDRFAGVWASLSAGRDWRGEFMSRRKDGEPYWESVTVSPVRDESGAMTHYLLIRQDVTERKFAEEELQRLRNYLSNVIDSMPSILVGVDRQCLITHFNAAAQKALGLTSEEVLGRPLAEAYPRLAAHVPGIRQAIGSQQPGRIEREMQRGEHTQTYHDIMIYPLVRNGVEGAVVRVDDVTERVHIEEIMIQTEKMMSLGGLAAGMAHEINNPLSAILQGMQVVLGHLSLEKEANRRIAAECGASIESIRAYMEKRNDMLFLNNIREAGERAARIVANMLEFSRKSESRQAPANLNAVLDKTVELALSDYDLKKNYDFKKVRIAREYDPDLPEVMCSRTEMEQVILNLLKNAAQAMSANATPEPAITLRTAHDTNFIYIEVTDNGPGMDEALRKRVFEPFFTTKGPGEGTGLGLSVSYFIIVTNHRGIIDVASEPGKGTTFTISLPILDGTVAET